MCPCVACNSNSLYCFLILLCMRPGTEAEFITHVQCWALIPKIIISRNAMCACKSSCETIAIVLCAVEKSCECNRGNYRRWKRWYSAGRFTKLSDRFEKIFKPAFQISQNALAVARP